MNITEFKNLSKEDLEKIINPDHIVEGTVEETFDPTTTTPGFEGYVGVHFKGSDWDVNNKKSDSEKICNLMFKECMTFDKPSVMEEIKKAEQDKGLRFNKGKIRYDLFEPFAMEQLAKIFTRGSEKYSDWNWAKGMKWSKMIASLKRHLAAFEKGEDFDFDENCEDCKSGNCQNHLGTYHMAQVAWNALCLVSYYKLHPQGDDRQHSYLNQPKIGLDLDEVLVDWVNPWCEKFGYCKPTAWHFSYENYDHFKSMAGDELNDFYLNLPARMKPEDMPFEPHCYITSRSIPVEITKQWIVKNGFPTVPIYCVGFGESKVEVAKKSGIDVFVDDRYDNFVELNNAGICTYLWDTDHNRRYNVGYKRIKSLKELIK